MLTKFVPHKQIDAEHPLFRYEAQRHPAIATSRGLWQASLVQFLAVGLVVLGVWLVMVVIIALLGDLRTAVTASGALISIFALLSLGSSLWLDYRSLVAALPTFSGEVTAGRWDLLRLTPLRVERVIAVKYALAQLRAWRSAWALMGARTGIFMLTGLHLLLLANNYGEYTAAQLFALGAMSAFPGLLLGITFIVEPFWRMQAITAIGLYVSSRVSDTATVWLVALGATFIVWIAQVFVFLGLLVAAVPLTFPMMMFSIASPEAGLLCALSFVGLLLLVAVYGMYALVRTVSLRRAVRRMRSRF